MIWVLTVMVLIAAAIVFFWWVLVLLGLVLLLWKLVRLPFRRKPGAVREPVVTEPPASPSNPRRRRNRVRQAFRHRQLGYRLRR